MTRSFTRIFTVIVFLCALCSDASAQLIISEFRVRGPNGANDEFIEIYNNSDVPHTVTAISGTGYGVAASDGTTRFSIPNGTIIPARGYYLGINSVGYSLASYPAGNGTTATGDATYVLDIPDNAGIALFNNNSGGGSYTLANRFDAVGSTSEANALYKEGAGYPALTPFSIDYTFYRHSLSGTPGVIIDNNNNAVDFRFEDTNGTSAGAGQSLGAPGPENLSSPLETPQLVVGLLDPVVSPSSPPNWVRDFTSDPANNSTFGTLDLRFRVTNNTGVNQSRLRFRVENISTFPSPSGISDLRPRTSTAVVVSTSMGNVTVQGTTLEQPPAQPNGGGFNSSMSVGTVTLGTPLAPGATEYFRLLLGIQQTGTASLTFIVEALPGPVGPPTDGKVIAFFGNTEVAKVNSFQNFNNPATATIAGTQTVCTGGTATLTFNITGTGTVTVTFQDANGAGVYTTTGTQAGSPLIVPVAGLGVGTHTFTVVAVEDMTGYGTVTGTAVVGVQGACVSATIAGNQNICAGNATLTFNVTGIGTVTVTVNDSQGGTYTVTGTQAGSPFTAPVGPLSAGTHTFTITGVQDQNGTGAGTGTVTVVVSTGATLAPLTQILCNGATSSITATFFGTPPFSYDYQIVGPTAGLFTDVINASSATYTATIPVPPAGNNAGTYTYTITQVRDANGCVGTGGNDAVVIVNPVPTATFNPQSYASCYGQTQTVTVNLVGNPPFTYQYTVTNGSTYTITLNQVEPTNILNLPGPPLGSQPGTYTYTIDNLADAQGCTGTATNQGTFVINPLPTAVISGTSTVCSGGQGVATFTVTGAGLITVTYSDGVLTGTATGTAGTFTSVLNTSPAAGVHTYTITSVVDANGCVATNTSGTATVTVNPLPTATVNGNSVVTSSLSPGDATISPRLLRDGFPSDCAVPKAFPGTFGTGPYFYEAMTYRNTTASAVCVTVTYQFTGGSDQVFVTAYSNSFDPSNLATNYLADGGSSSTLAVPIIREFSFSLPANTSVVLVANTSNVGGTVDYVMTVTGLPNLAGTTSVCYGSPSPQIVFEGAGGTAPYTFTYNINGGAPVILSTTGGNSTATVAAPTNVVGSFAYNLTNVVDANGCSRPIGGTATVVVIQLPTAVYRAGTASQTVCAGTFTNVYIDMTGTAPGSYSITYAVNGVPTTVSPVTGNTYTITAPPAPGSAGIYNYTIVGVQDLLTGCTNTSTSTATVTVNALPTGVIAGTTSVCTGGTASLNFTITGAAPVAVTYTYAPGGGTYSLVFNPATGAPVSRQVVTPVTPGTYTYTITGIVDANGCVATATSGTGTVTVNPLPTATYLTPSQVICYGSTTSISISLTGTPPFILTLREDGPTAGVASGTFVINAPDVTLALVPTTPTIAGVYTYTIVDVTDANGCTNAATSTATITVLPQFTVTSTVVPNPVCNPGTTTVTITPSINPSTPPLTGTVTYTLVGPVSGVRTATALNPVSFGGLTGSPQPGGATYTVTAVNANGCVATHTFTVIQNPPISGNIIGAINPTCPGLSDGSYHIPVISGGYPPYQISSNGGVTYKPWPGPGTTSFTGMPAGIYVTFVRDALGCVMPIGTVTLIDPTSVTLGQPVVVGQTCASSGSITIRAQGGTGSYTYTLTSPGGATTQQLGGTNSVTFSNLTGGTYTITVQDSNNCPAGGVSQNVVVAGGTPDLLLTSSINPPIASFPAVGSQVSITYTISSKNGISSNAIIVRVTKPFSGYTMVLAPGQPNSWTDVTPGGVTGFKEYQLNGSVPCAGSVQLIVVITRAGIDSPSTGVPITAAVRNTTSPADLNDFDNARASQFRVQ